MYNNLWLRTKVSRVSRGDGCGAALTDAGLVCNAVEEWGEKDGVLLEKQPKEGELLEEQSEVEEEEGGDEEEEKGDTGRGVGTDEGKKKRKGGLYSLPTHDELQQIRETENLFHSNLMRLQVNHSYTTTVSLFHFSPLYLSSLPSPSSPFLPLIPPLLSLPPS